MLPRVITLYITSLRDAVGLGWLAPSLAFLAQYWFHPSGACESLPQVLVFMRFRVPVEIRLAARALFGAAADRLSDDDTICLVEYWQHELCECPFKVYERWSLSPYCSALSVTRCRKIICLRGSRAAYGGQRGRQEVRCFRQGPHLAFFQIIYT